MNMEHMDNMYDMVLLSVFLSFASKRIIVINIL